MTALSGIYKNVLPGAKEKDDSKLESLYRVKWNASHTNMQKTHTMFDSKFLENLSFRKKSETVILLVSNTIENENWVRVKQTTTRQKS